MPRENLSKQRKGTDDPRQPQTCATCVANALGFCKVADKATLSAAPSMADRVQQSGHIVPARQIICRTNDLHDVVPIVCEGWAASIVNLTDGRRQIVSFLLSGDMVSTAHLFAAPLHCLVEAITPVRYRVFRRTDLLTMLFGDPNCLKTLLERWVREKERADQLIVDLGRRNSQERVARLILYLADRLAQRDLARGEPLTMEFPLRQRHIADATGLTPVHVSKVLSEFGRSGYIEISNRTLTILAPTGFRRVADWR